MKKRAFTLMEALVSFVILGIFVAIIAAVMGGRSGAGGITGYFANYEEVGFPITVDGTVNGQIRYVEAGKKDEDAICDANTGKCYKNNGYDEKVVKKRRIFTRLSDLPKGCSGILNIADLDKIRENANGCYFLMDDINFTSYKNKETRKVEEWKKGWTPIESFSGRFYGNGKILYNMSNSLFGTLKDGAIVQDFGIHDSNFTSAPLAESAEGKVEIRSVYLKDVNITPGSEKSSIGGLINSVSGDLSLTLFYNNIGFSTKDITDAAAGGIIGKITEGGNVTISRSSNSSDIIGEETFNALGGFVGSSEGSVNIRYSLNEGSLRSTKENSPIGGFVGNSSGKINIKESYSKGKIASGKNSPAGGFVGKTSADLTIENSYATNIIGGKGTLGGFVGELAGTASGGDDEERILPEANIQYSYVIPRFEGVTNDTLAGMFVGHAANYNMVAKKNYWYTDGDYTNIDAIFGNLDDSVVLSKENEEEDDEIQFEDPIDMTFIEKGDKKWFAAEEETEEGVEPKVTQKALFSDLDENIWLLEKKYRPILKKTPEAVGYIDYTSAFQCPDVTVTVELDPYKATKKEICTVLLLDDSGSMNWKGFTSGFKRYEDLRSILYKQLGCSVASTTKMNEAYIGMRTYSGGINIKPAQKKITDICKALNSFTHCKGADTYTWQSMLDSINLDFKDCPEGYTKRIINFSDGEWKTFSSPLIVNSGKYGWYAETGDYVKCTEKCIGRTCIRFEPPSGNTCHPKNFSKINAKQTKDCNDSKYKYKLAKLYSKEDKNKLKDDLVTFKENKGEVYSIMGFKNNPSKSVIEKNQTLAHKMDGEFYIAGTGTTLSSVFKALLPTYEPEIQKLERTFTSCQDNNDCGRNIGLRCKNGCCEKYQCGVVVPEALSSCTVLLIDTSKYASPSWPQEKEILNLVFDCKNNPENSKLNKSLLGIHIQNNKVAADKNTVSDICKKIRYTNITADTFKKRLKTKFQEVVDNGFTNCPEGERKRILYISANNINDSGYLDQNIFKDWTKGRSVSCSECLTQIQQDNKNYVCNIALTDSAAKRISYFNMSTDYVCKEDTATRTTLYSLRKKLPLLQFLLDFRDNENGTIDVIGFDMTDGSQTIEEDKLLTEIMGGVYYDARDMIDLRNALQELLGIRKYQYCTDDTDCGRDTGLTCKKGCCKK